MASGKGKISLNEINFGSSLFPGSAEMLANCAGRRNAEIVAYTGAMFSLRKAKRWDSWTWSCPPESLEQKALETAKDFAARYGPAFESIKKLLRHEVGEEMKRKDRVYRDEKWSISGIRKIPGRSSRTLQSTVGTSRFDVVRFKQRKGLPCVPLLASPHVRF